MPLMTAGVVKGVVFNCQLAAGTNHQLRLSVAGSLVAPTGASFETSPGVPGGYSLLIDNSMWQMYDNACSNIVLP
jgi:hypothetical protein